MNDAGRRTVGCPRARPDRGGHSGRDRGQSTTLDYTLALGVAALAISGLFVAGGDFVNDRRQEVVRTELGVVGQQLADDIAASDRLVQAGNETETVRVNASAPRRIAGVGYTISIDDDGGGDLWVNLSTSDPDVTVPTRVETETDVATGSVPGGPVTVRYDADADRLEVQN